MMVVVKFQIVGVLMVSNQKKREGCKLHRQKYS